MRRVCLVLLAMTAAVAARAELKPVDLRCEYLKDPLGIDTPKPRLSWKLESTRRGARQTAYQVVVESGGKLWDSGQVASAQQLFVEYGGPALKSAQRCSWKVRVWDEGGRASGWSAPASWEMGLLAPEDWHGKWIARTTDTAYQPAPMLRREFSVDGKIAQARLYICGLGYFDASMNGRRVGDHLLDPGYTRFDLRHLYVTHDVTRLLKQGPNAIGVMLGTGWFNVHTKAVWYFDRAPWRAAPKLLAEIRIRYADGREQVVATDGEWRTSTGPIVFDSIYGGQTYDFTQEKPGWDRPGYDASGWQTALLVDAPPGILAAQQMPPIRATAEIKPVRVTEPKPGVYLFDFGQNFAGYARLRPTPQPPPASGKGSTDARAFRIVMKYGERLNKDGTLDQSNLDVHQVKETPPHAFQTDTYILPNLKSKTQNQKSDIPRFCYHGFQYVEMTGFPGKPTVDTLMGVFIHSDVEPVGEFECSNELLNKIWRASRWSYLSNMESIFTDCPHREKNGWTGDAHLACEQGLFNFESPAVYTKWMNDLNDEQRPTGELPGIVPTSGWGYEWGNGPAWDSAFLLIPYYVYLYHGDARLLTSHYIGMKRYVDYLSTKAKDGIVSIGLGDWAPWKAATPEAVTSTGYYYVDALIVAKAAELLGNAEDAVKYTELAASIRKAFNAKFYHPETGLYAEGTQTALACALYQGLAEPADRDRILANLVAAIHRTDDHIDTGILGAKYLLNTLTDGGHADLAYTIATQKTQPSWGWWFEQGATTLWETWQGPDSRNHIMYGDITAWMYKTLAGINPDPAAPGFAHFTVKPNVVPGLTYARARYRSCRGLIESDWRLESGALTFHVRVPPNSTATIWVPAVDVQEGGRAAAQAEGLKPLRTEAGYTLFEAASGDYHFTSEVR